MTNKIKLLFLSIFCIFNLNIYASDQCIVQRAAFEFGSGKTKALFAEYDECQNKIVKIIKRMGLRMPYQHYVSISPTKDMIIDDGMKQGMEITQKLINDLGVDCSKARCFGVATAAFRNAKNAGDYLDKIKQKFNIEVKVVDQEEEGILGFLSGFYGISNHVSEVKKEELAVVDIGGGSYQISFLDEDNKIAIYQGNLGAVSFKNTIIELVQNRPIYEIGTINPIASSEVKKSLSLGTDLITNSIIASPQMRNMIKNKKYVAGIGGLMGISIVELIKEDYNPLTSEKLISWADKLTLKSDEALNKEFDIDDGNTILPNVILVKSVLDAFKRPLYIASIDNVEAILNLGPQLRIKEVLEP